MEHLEAGPKSRDFPFQLRLLPLWKRSQGGARRDHRPCACLMVHMCSHCHPGGRDRGHQLLQQGPTLPGAAGNRERARLRARGKSQGAPTDKQWQSGHKATQRVGIDSPVWLVWVVLFPECGSAFPFHQSPLWHQHSPCWCQRRAGGCKVIFRLCCTVRL